MTEEKDDRGPYTVKGRFGPSGEEHPIASGLTLDDAKAYADKALAATGFSEINVTDREGRNVYAPHAEEQHKQTAAEKRAAKKADKEE